MPGSTTLLQLRKRLRELEKEIAEAKKGLPAHSIKPPLMMDLLALEDEYDTVMKQIQEKKKSEG